MLLIEFLLTERLRCVEEEIYLRGAILDEVSPQLTDFTQGLTNLYTFVATSPRNSIFGASRIERMAASNTITRKSIKAFANQFKRMLSGLDHGALKMAKCNCLLIDNGRSDDGPNSFSEHFCQTLPDSTSQSHQHHDIPTFPSDPMLTRANIAHALK